MNGSIPELRPGREKLARSAGCFSSWVEPVGTGTTTVRFADLMGGSPVSGVDAAKLTGLHWQFMPPVGAAAASCAASFTVDDVSFVP